MNLKVKTDFETLKAGDEIEVDKIKPDPKSVGGFAVRRKSNGIWMSIGWFVDVPVDAKRWSVEGK